jgi:hypothetical protein
MQSPEKMKRRWINAWKRRNSRKTKGVWRIQFAYNVPGTREHGALSMWEAQSAESFR